MVLSTSDDTRELISMEAAKGWKRKAWSIVSIKMVNGKMISKKPIALPMYPYTPDGHRLCKRKMQEIRNEIQRQKTDSL